MLPKCFAIHSDEIISWFSLNVFCGYFALSKGTNKALVRILPIFSVSFGKNMDI